MKHETIMSIRGNIHNIDVAGAYCYFNKGNRWFVVREGHKPNLLPPGVKPTKRTMEYDRAFSGQDVGRRLAGVGGNPRMHEAWLCLGLLVTEEGQGREIVNSAKVGYQAACSLQTSFETERYLLSE